MLMQSTVASVVDGDEGARMLASVVLVAVVVAIERGDEEVVGELIMMVVLQNVVRFASMVAR